MRRKAQNRKYQQVKVEKEKGADACTRRRNFQIAMLRGPEYVCSCCHRSLFRKSVTAVTDNIREKIKAAKSKQRSSDKSYSEQNYFKKEPDDSNSENIYLCLEKYEMKSVDSKCYLCSTCKAALLMGRMPAMAVANGLQLNNAPDRPDLTELENNLIAHNINFQKIVLLHKSRWPAGKGRMVSVPVGPDDIMNTVKQLPRLPSEAGLVPIKLKRMQKYKGHEKKEMIRPEKIFQALQSLRHHGHPFYQFYDSKEYYMVRCRERDERLQAADG